MRPQKRDASGREDVTEQMALDPRYADHIPQQVGGSQGTELVPKVDTDTRRLPVSEDATSASTTTAVRMANNDSGGQGTRTPTVGDKREPEIPIRQDGGDDDEYPSRWSAARR